MRCIDCTLETRHDVKAIWSRSNIVGTIPTLVILLALADALVPTLDPLLTFVDALVTVLECKCRFETNEKIASRPFEMRPRIPFCMANSRRKEAKAKYRNMDF